MQKASVGGCAGCSLEETALIFISLVREWFTVRSEVRQTAQTYSYEEVGRHQRLPVGASWKFDHKHQGTFESSRVDTELPRSDDYHGLSAGLEVTYVR